MNNQQYQHRRYGMKQRETKTKQNFDNTNNITNKSSVNNAGR